MSLIYPDLDSLKALSCFDSISDVSILKNGLSHTCIKVTTPSQAYFVKRLNQATSQTEVFCTKVVSQADLLNRLCPQVIYNDDNWLVTEFIEGETLASSSLSYHERLTTGLTLITKFHQLLPLDDTQSIPRLNTLHSVSRLLTSQTNPLISKRIVLDKVTQLLTTEINAQIAKSGSPHRLCHGDINYTNILIDTSHRSWLIDFECAHLAPVEFDIAMFIAVNNISMTSLNNITREYMNLVPDRTINNTLLTYYILYSYFINGLWYYDNMNNVKESAQFISLAIEQWTAFDNFASKVPIDIPHLAQLLNTPAPHHL
jgi:thiamine kinase-like enzyme